MEPIHDARGAPGEGHFAGLFAGAWLSRQPAAFRQHLIAVGRRAFYGRRDPIGFEGDDDRRILGIVSGSIGCLTSHRQHMPVLGTIIGPGQWFGMGPQLIGSERILSFVAREPSELISLGDTELWRLREAFPDLPQRLAGLAQLQSNHIAGLVAELLVPEADRRIAAVLLRLCEPGSGKDSLPLSQSELGEMANASRASVSRTLRVLAQRGLVEVGYGRIAVEDRAGLEAWFETSRTVA
ncbi:Crp/Fnr family transcriptional regulator [Erythrobacter sp.]|jgi:CRP-like cAMP-binding protein|uniref:Crp/Fnr family transcriptional regulator n=1 Tax=Erythrobacter sp. TaxID=1042 RepID=UPI002E9A1012|nr:Crp/Fnr family transcriptional regulator [Erythrobacter sp.]